MTATRGIGTVLAPIVLLLMAATALPAQPSVESAAAPQRSGPAPATLTVWNRPIVVFRATIGQVPPADRAATAARRIEARVFALTIAYESRDRRPMPSRPSGSSPALSSRSVPPVS